jgi:hypothetical protein
MVYGDGNVCLGGHVVEGMVRIRRRAQIDLICGAKEAIIHVNELEVYAYIYISY